MSTKVDWIELNLAVQAPCTFEGRVWKRPGSDAVVPIFRKSPMHAACMAWRYRYGRSGLTPFTLAYLTNYKGGPEKLHENLASGRERAFHYSYCGTTRLPVVGSCIRFGWNNNFTYDDYDNSIPAEHRWDWPSIEESFQRCLRDWNYMKDHDHLSDDYVRRFGGYPIKAEAWGFIKGLVDAYRA